MRVLVVDDDRVLADLIAFTFRREGHEVIQAHSGTAALKRWREDAPDLIVLDVNLPDVPGFSVCQEIRAESATPVILLTVRGGDDDIVHGLGIGADDYITKPFSPRQLIARAQSVTRRFSTPAQPAVLEVGPLRLDPARRELHIEPDRQVELTVLENQLLHYLLINCNRVLPYSSIIDHVWGREGGTPNMVRQLVYRLRLKIEADSTDPIHLKTVPGVGYELKVESTEQRDAGGGTHQNLSR
jgi:DNA-binding response OmpR family regulator